MTTSILNDCLLIRNQSSEKLIEYLHSINLHIFDPLFEASDNLDFEPKLKVLYILTAFSEESPLVILRQDSKTEQENICEYLQIPELYRNNLINLTDKKVRMAVTAYVQQFSSQRYRALVFAKIQLRDLELCATNRDFATLKELKEPEEGQAQPIYAYDQKEHGKTVSEIIRLARIIDNLEKEIGQEVKKLSSILDLEEYKTGGHKRGARKSFNGSIENIIK